MSTTSKGMATAGFVLVAGLAAAAACAPLESSEPETASASSALNVNPSRSGTTALSAGRNFGTSCALWDTGRNREVAITAFGYNGTVGPNYLNSYDVFDNGANPKWTSSGTVQVSGGASATAAAYVASVVDPDLNDGNAAHLTTCWFAGGFDGTNLSKQVWRATIANGTPVWTKMTDMNVARAKFGLAVVGTSTRTLMAVGGGFGATRTNTIETFNRANPGTWTTDGTNTLDQAVDAFGFVKLSDTKLVAAGGDIAATTAGSEHINAIKVAANGTVDSVGDLKNSGATFLAARKDNIVVPTGRTTATGLGGTDRVEILVAMGQDNTATLLASATTVEIEWNSSPPVRAAHAAGTAPPGASGPAAFPTVVDAYLTPKNATSNPGYIIISGFDRSNPQAPVNAIRKWTPDSSGGAWNTSTTLGQNRLGINAVYIKSIDQVLASGGTNRYTAGLTSVDYTNADFIQ